MYHGIPLALKDNLYFKDKVTTMASKIHKDFSSDADATVVEKLREAGVIFTGKLSMHEYAWGLRIIIRILDRSKPVGSTKIPGAQAAALVLLWQRVPVLPHLEQIRQVLSAFRHRLAESSELKPTHGRVSKFGCFPLAWTLDHIGPMTKTVKDAAAMLEIISGFDHRDPTCVDRPVDQYVNYLTGT